MSTSLLHDNDDDDHCLPYATMPSADLSNSFYKAVVQDLLLSRNDSFFNYLFSEIFSRKVKATINGKVHSYEDLRQHFLSLRKTYYSHAADGVLRFGPFLSSSFNGGREGYIAAHMVMASLACNDAEDRASGMLQYNALLVSDTLEVQWVEGKEGEMRRISRFDRTTARPVESP